MDLRKHQEYFDAEQVTDNVHIIGLGAIGSNIADQIARLGITNIHLWDIDTVERKNVTNQAYSEFHMGHEKTHAMQAIILDVNPDAQIILHDNGYTDEKLDGYVFIAVDSIKVRKQIVENNIGNDKIKMMLDTRIALTEAQGFADVDSQWKYLLSTMQFTDEQAKEETPISACGEILSIRTVCLIITSLQVQNMIDYIKKHEYNKMLMYFNNNYKLMTAKGGK